jgi:Lamin Tail Domain
MSLVCAVSLIVSVAIPATIHAAQRTTSKKKSKKSKRKHPTHQLVLPTYPIRVGPPNKHVGAKTIPPTPLGSQKRIVSKQAVQSTQKSISGLTASSIKSVQRSAFNFRAASKKRTGPNLTVITGQRETLVPAPGTITEAEEPEMQSLLTRARVNAVGPLVPSPGPSQNFQGAIDEAIGGGPSGTFTIPPDTTGAVGIDKVVNILNNNIVIQDKLSGSVLSLASLNSFWSSTGATGPFDPRIMYDPYNNRWLIAATSNAQTANSSILIGISDTADPMGSYALFRFIVGCAAGSAGCNAEGGWADFPMLGFNKNWVAVGWNQFAINTLQFTDGRMLVLDYPSLRAGTDTATLFIGAVADIGGFCMHPATTMSPTEETLYIATHISSAGAIYRLHKITGTPDSPVFNVDPANRTRPGGGWTQPGGDSLPQQCIPGVGQPTQTCPATIRNIETADAFVRSNVVFRNGKIYYPQTIALPTGGLTTNSRFVAQWTVLNADGTFADGGRVEDVTATLTNGGKHFAYPSIAVNKNDDILFGFSEFESDDYVDAGYTFRTSGDPAGTMRDPVVYKEGEDYYQKTFGGTRNRWGDYSHTIVDPINDRDLWTLQEYSRLREGVTGEGSNDSRWGTWWAKVSGPVGDGDLIISEFRLRGPNGANDEFVEIYNPGSNPITVETFDGSSGYSLVASDGNARFTIPNGTVIPAKGHYLGVNSVGYSLASYPSGSGTLATGDATYTMDIADNAGIALFATSASANFTLANRLDAVGSTSETNTLYREGTGYNALTPFSIDYSFYRDSCGKAGSITTFGPCPTGGLLRDTNNNASDFVFVDINGTSAGAGQRLGAPGPENISSPIERNGSFPVNLLDPCVGAGSPPNRVRDFSGGPTFGTLEIRRTVVNNTGGDVSRLRFRVVDLTTFPAPAGIADLRPRTSTDITITVDRAPCGSGSSDITVRGTSLEQPPSQPNGGGFNSSMSAGTVSLAAPLANGASIDLRFLLGIQQTGSFKFYINVEALP